MSPPSTNTTHDCLKLAHTIKCFWKGQNTINTTFTKSESFHRKHYFRTRLCIAFVALLTTEAQPISNVAGSLLKMPIGQETKFFKSVTVVSLDSTFRNTTCQRPQEAKSCLWQLSWGTSEKHAAPVLFVGYMRGPPAVMLQVVISCINTNY